MSRQSVFHKFINRIDSAMSWLNSDTPRATLTLRVIVALVPLTIASGIIAWLSSLSFFTSLGVCLLVIVIFGGTLLLTKKLRQQTLTPKRVSDVASSKPVADMETGSRQPQSAGSTRALGLDEQLAPPPVYSEKRHVKYVLKRMMAWIGVFALGIGITWLLLMFETTLGWWAYSGTLAVGFALLGAYRSYWIWENHPLICNPYAGVLSLMQPGNRLLFVRGSAPDNYPIGRNAIQTPPQTISEMYIFRRSQTIVLSGTKGDGGQNFELRLSDVLDVERLLAIQLYREGLDKQSVGLQHETVRQLRTINETLERMLSELQRQSSLMALVFGQPKTPDGE